MSLGNGFLVSVLRAYFYTISVLNCTTFQYLNKNPFLRHNTVTGLVIYFTSSMTLFAYLAHFDFNHITDH